MTTRLADRSPSPERRMSLLIVDDNPGMIQVAARLLEGLGSLKFATNGEAALAQMREAPPDLVLLDAEMPGMNGFQVCELMQQDPVLAEVPVIFVTGHSEAEFELKGLEAGAVDFIAKPIRGPLLLARVKTQLRIKGMQDQLRQWASIDGLTGIANRRTFDDTFAREWKRAARTGDALCLLMLDVDHFKRFNDHYGHPAGDACLRSVAQALRGVVRRPADLVARVGGEEFAILLPHTTGAGAEQVAADVLQAVRSLGIAHAKSSTAAWVTVSVGIGVCDAGGAAAGSAADLTRCADQALYHAKGAGRDRAMRLRFDDAGHPVQAQEVPACTSSDHAV